MLRNMDFSVRSSIIAPIPALEDRHIAKAQKARMSKSKLKFMLIFFTDIQYITIIEQLTQDQTINRKYYISRKTKLTERLRNKSPDLENNHLWILQEDNVLALPVKQYLPDKNITVLEQPPYALDRVSCDFFMSLKVKCALQGTHFQSVEKDKAKQQTLKRVTLDDLQHCFEQWKACMQRYRQGKVVC